MANKPKDKGRRFENQIRDRLINGGIPAERIPLSGSLGGKYDSDVVIGTAENTLAKIECKHRESMSKQNWEWLDGNDFLAIKRNGIQFKPLIVMDIDKFIQLYIKANKGEL